MQDTGDGDERVDLAGLAATSTWATDTAELWDIKRQAGRLGWIEVAIRKGDSTVTKLRPTTQEQANPSSLSATHGRGEQPLHTDGAHLSEPPDVVLLYAEEPNETPTLLWTPEIRGEGQPPLVPGRPSHAADGVFLVRSGNDRFLTTAYTDANGYRYDPGCMTPCDQRARSVVRHFQEAQTSALRHAWSLPNQVLVINNHNVLHARAAVSEEDTGRVLTRIAYRTRKQG